MWVTASKALYNIRGENAQLRITRPRNHRVQSQSGRYRDSQETAKDLSRIHRSSPMVDIPAILWVMKFEHSGYPKTPPKYQLFEFILRKCFNAMIYPITSDMELEYDYSKQLRCGLVFYNEWCMLFGPYKPLVVAEGSTEEELDNNY